MTEVGFRDIAVPPPEYDAVAARTREIEAALDAARDAAGRLEALRRWDALRRELET